MKMARNSAPQEVIEILSDDDSLTRAIVTHTGSQARSAGTRKPNASNPAKRDSLQAHKKSSLHPHDGFIGRHSASTTPSSKHHPTAIKRTAESNSRPARESELLSFPTMTNDGARESHTNSNGTRPSSTKRDAPTIVVSDDDEPVRPKSFVWPRGLSPDTGADASLVPHDSGSPYNGRSSSPKKRPRQRDSPSNSFGPSKRLKLSQVNGEEKSALKFGNFRQNGEAPSSVPPSQLPLRSPQTASKWTARGDKVNSAASSPRRRRKAVPALSDGEDDNASQVSSITSSIFGLVPNTESNHVPSSPRKRTRDKEENLSKSSRVPDNLSPVLNGESTPKFGFTEVASERAKPKDGRSPSGTLSKALPLRADWQINPKAMNANDQTFPTNESRRSGSPSRVPHPDNDINGPRQSTQVTSQRSKPTSEAGDISSHRSASQHGSEAVNSDKSSSAPNGMRRTDSLEDDQGYVSLSSGNNDGSSQKRKKHAPPRAEWLKRGESIGVKPEEHHWGYGESERPSTEHRPIKQTKSGTQKRSNKLDPVRVRSAKSSPEAAVISREIGEQNASQTPDAELAVDTEDQKSSSMRANNAFSYGITESDEADLQLRSEALQSSTTFDVVMADSESAFAQPTTAASALKAAALYSGLSLANRVEKVLGGYMEELRGDTEYWTSVALRRARLFKEQANDAASSKPTGQSPEEVPTSFSNLKPLKLSPHKKGSSSAKPDELWAIQRIAQDGKPQAQMELSASYTTFATDRQDVPDFAHYVSLQNNLLAPNVIHLHGWPYFGDDFDMTEAQNLHSQYNIDIVSRERKILLLLQAQLHERYVESALQDLECSFADVLRFLLEASPDVGSDLDARKAYQNRGLYCQEDFSRSSDRWAAVLSRLPPSSPVKLGRAALLCENFQKMAKFSVWHIARKSAFADLPEDKGRIMPAQPSDNELTCRICLRFNCPYHGQFKHRPEDSGGESDTESISSADTAVATDIIHPLKANFRSRVTFMPDATTVADPEPGTVADPLLRKKQRDQNYWSGYRHKADERGPFYPCSHPGRSCSDAKCSCFAKMIPCEKTCSCPPDCVRKFKGCSCGVRKGHQMVCAENPECVCWQNGRECDPDLCGSCGVCDVVDPVNKYDDQILIGHCRNASIQRGVPKHTLLGDSGVHGLGLYACEDIKHHHFVGEYKGEIITKKEADRRGAVYEYQKLSYLFSLNKSQEIDSTYFGNKVRFINHAHGEKANLYPRIIMVNTVHRIALYASKDIPAGKELLFDYGPLFPDEQLQGKKSKKSAPESKKSAPHVRNANLVKEFYDVSESEDEDGILRAKAVSRGRGRPSNKKARGGTRAGAGRKPHVSKPPQPAGASKAAEPAKEVEQDAGERLAAFNISDDTPSEAVDADVGLEEEDEDEAFEPEDSESVDSEESEGEEGSDSDDDEEDDDDDEDRDPVVWRGRGRPRGRVMNTRRRGRR